MNKELKISLLGSYTLNSLKNDLSKVLNEKGILNNIFLGGYNQFNQELIDPNSWLNKEDPEFTCILHTFDSFFPHAKEELSKEGFKSALEKCESKIKDMITAIEAYKGKATILVTNFEYQSDSPLSILDASKEESLAKIVEKCNDLLVRYAEKGMITLIDFKGMVNTIGKDNVRDEKMHYLGKIELTKNSSEYLAKLLSRYIGAKLGFQKKVLVMDLDNTLWKGVVGEEGIEGIIVDDSNMGAIYRDIQKAVLMIKSRGILLAVCSKNNEEDALNVFKQKKGMVIKKEDLSAYKINWNKKSENIKEIINELNVGKDSIVFLDDNPVERAEVKQAIPEVEIFDFPNDVANLPKLLRESDFFDTIALTPEDKKRSEMYAQERLRKSSKVSTSIKDYLLSLKTEVEIKSDDTSSLSRITQLINKTNQFNMRTKRYTEDEVQKMMLNNEHSIISLKVWDKFGELGLTGVIIFKIDKEKESAFVDTFLLSCRILSREIEKLFFSKAIEMLIKKENALKTIDLEWLKTNKNEPAKKFYEEFGCKQINNSEDQKSYVLKISEWDKKEINHIKVR